MKYLLAVLLLAAVSEAFDCPSAGIFPKEDCTGFYVCGRNLLTGVGELEVIYDYACDAGALYNTGIRRCEEGYVCPEK